MTGIWKCFEEKNTHYVGGTMGCEGELFNLTPLLEYLKMMWEQVKIIQNKTADDTCINRGIGKKYIVLSYGMILSLNS